MKSEYHVVKEHSDADISLKEEQRRFWNYETLGIKEKGEDDNFFEDYCRKVRFDGNFYEVSLPFRDEHPIIPDNYLLAQNRLNSSLKRLRSNPEFLQQYDNARKYYFDRNRDSGNYSYI